MALIHNSLGKMYCVTKYCKMEHRQITSTVLLIDQRMLSLQQRKSQAAERSLLSVKVTDIFKGGGICSTLLKSFSHL